jgi:hypothetical protein
VGRQALVRALVEAREALNPPAQLKPEAAEVVAAAAQLHRLRHLHPLLDWPMAG